MSLLRAMIALIPAAFALPVSALDIPVRSGEHDTFSRLVLQIPKGASWTLEQGGRWATLSVGGAETVFRTGQVFDRIPRARIAEVEQGATGAPLQLRLNCDCPVTAFLQSATYLVLDVSSPDPPSEIDAPTRPRHMAWIGSATQYRYRAYDWSDGPPLPQRLGQISRFPGPYPPAPAAAPDIPGQGQRTPAPSVEITALPDPATADVLNLSQLRLQEQIARAANQGLLTPRTTGLPSGADAPNSEPSPTKVSPSKKPADETQVLFASTSADRGKAQIQLRDGKTAEGSACVASEMVAVASWSDGAEFRHGLGHLRSGLYSDTGAFQSEAATELARFYIHFGFGLEAEQLLDRANSDGRTDGVVRAIARLIDDEPRSRSGDFGDQAGCTTDIALWSFLASAQPGMAPQPDESAAILRAFTKLPPHLRVHLGPRLSRLFLKVGDTTRASDVLRAIDQGTGTKPAGSRMAQAEIDLRRGHEGAAAAQLENVIAGQTEHSPEALAILIETAHENGAPPAESLSDLAAAYAAELRGTSIGDRLRRAHVLALTMENRFDAALSAIDGGLVGDANHARRIRSDVLAALTDRADDVTFLNLALRELDRAEAELEAPVGNAVAERLLNLGFRDAAVRALIRPLSARKTDARRVLRARIALEEELPNRALVELAGLASETAEHLRARALSMSGEFRSAALSFERSDDPENVARAYWLDGAWDLVPTTDASPLGAAAALAGSLRPTEITAEGPLGEARHLLESSAAARENIEKLLSTVADPVESLPTDSEIHWPAAKTGDP